MLLSQVGNWALLISFSLFVCLFFFLGFGVSSLVAGFLRTARADRLLFFFVVVVVVFVWLEVAAATIPSVLFTVAGFRSRFFLHFASQRCAIGSPFFFAHKNKNESKNDGSRQSQSDAIRLTLFRSRTDRQTFAVPSNRKATDHRPTNQRRPTERVHWLLKRIFCWTITL